MKTKKTVKTIIALSLAIILTAVSVPVSADTEHFKSSEFKCSHCGKLPSQGISQDLMNKLELLRAKLGGKPIIILSGYRCAAYNKTLDGAAENSQHLYGKAADIYVSGVSPKVVANTAESIFGNGGLGRYSGFTHVDVRGYKARWNG